MVYSKLITVLDSDETLNNVIVALSLEIDEVFYIYHHEISKQLIDNIKKVILKYKNIKLHFISLKNDEKEINDILKNNLDIIVDVGGEKYLSLVLFDKVLSSNNQIIYYDDEENKIKSYRNHTIIINKPFKLSIEDILNLRGGTIEQILHTPIKSNDLKSIRILKKAVLSSIFSYGKFTSFIQKTNSIIAKKDTFDGTTYKLNIDQIKKLVTDEQYHKYKNIGLLDIKDDILIFPTKAIADLFKVSGAFLENYLYLELIKSKYFDDVIMSAVIDFSGNDRRYPIVCEIDCLVIKDNHLLFVSCKSNKVDTGDLNEIKVHDTMFGNKLSNAVLCTIDDLNIKSPSVYGKARELGVLIIDNTSFEANEVALRFKEIINGKYNYEKINDN